jgi:hypothetical protein
MGSSTYDFSLLSALTILVQVMLPILVAVVTKTSASGTVKALALLVLTSVTQFVSMWIDNFNHFDVKVAGVNVVVGFVISAATYFGLWKPTGAASAASRIGPQ